MSKYLFHGVVFDTSEMEPNNCACLPAELKFLMNYALHSKLLSVKEMLTFIQKTTAEAQLYGTEGIQTEGLGKFYQEIKNNFPLSHEEEEKLEEEFVENSYGSHSRRQDEYALYDKVRRIIHNIPTCPGSKLKRLEDSVGVHKLNDIIGEEDVSER